MYLKEIEITGFKSFADKTIISLDNNITCIVGPNGSGKSNILDAVRWVMGEQSVKSLRGDDKMSDIIFSGSKSRNSLSACSVTLTFDNSDHVINLSYDTVSIKRRMFKNGENEYYINNNKCRHKDIIELLLDTGVGKSSFNIISQGDISKVLSNSSMDRRMIIEEAAGILKYKSRREEALRKLDKTNDNLDRLNDIISELETRVEPLRIQSEKAKEYISVKDKLSNLEINLLVNEIDNINIVYQDNKNKIDNINSELLVLNNKLSNNDLLIEKNNNLNIEKKLSEYNNKLIALTKEESDLDSKRIIIKERSKYNSNDVKIHDNIYNLNLNKNDYLTKISIINNEINNLNIDLNNIKNNINNLINDLNNNKKDYNNYLNEYNIINKKRLNIENEINIINNNINNNSSLSNSTRSILDNPKLRGVHNAFSNIVDCDIKYSKALEVSISGVKNSIIVDNSNNAKDCINYLKDNKLGRVTFLPLDVIKPKYIDYETIDILKRSNLSIGILSDFLKYDIKYKNIILNSCGNIIVVNNIDDGNKLSKLIDNKYRIVSLDGEIIHVGGSITGGSLNNSFNLVNLKNNLINNKNELNKLNNKYNELDNIIKDKENNINNINNKLLETRNKYNELESIINIKNNNLSNYNKELDNITLELDNLNNLSNGLTSEEEKINNLYFDKVKEKELLIQDINNINKEYDISKSKILELEGIDKDTNSKIKTLENELKNLEINVSKMDFKLDNNLNILNSEYSMTYEKAKELSDIIEDLESLRSNVNIYKNKLKNIGMVNIDSISEYESVSERYNFLNNQKEDLFKAKDTLYNIIDDMDEIMKKDFKKTFDELQIEFAKVFKELFKGGTACLKMVNPDNILETGIDIVATPPGKSLKSLSLLSGGEKTLTAISLLFSILNIRKVPFCIFDEVEAALDESNVDTFGKYLDNYKNKTQFLLITHKKRTMEYAKTLYGITMQESGISKLVSVKLEGN